MKFRFAPIFAVLVGFYLSPQPAVRADGVTIEYNADPGVDIDPEWVASDNDTALLAYHQILTEFWHKPEKPPAKPRRLSESLVTSKLVVQTMSFIRNMSGRSESFARNSRSEFLHTIGQGAPPGYAWFVMV